MPLADSWRDLVENFDQSKTEPEHSGPETPRPPTGEERVASIVVLVLLVVIVVAAGCVGWLHPWNTGAH